jgi:ribosomal protein L21E
MTCGSMRSLFAAACLAAAASTTAPLGARAAADGEPRITGNLTAVDSLSQPPSITVTYRNSVRTIATNPAAKVVLEDVLARTRQGAQLADLRVGDAVSVAIDRDGTAALIEDRYGSRTGTIAGVSESAIVLDGGNVLVPDRTTTIVLDGDPATLGELRVGDVVTQRMNPDTGETTQLLATRAAASPAPSVGAPASGSPSTKEPAIDAFTVEPLRPLRLGEKFTFILEGTPGGRATYDLGSLVTGEPMHEQEPGVYRATLTVAPGMNFARMPVFGRLAAAGLVTRQRAANTISAAAIGPQITEVAPADGQIVNNDRPSIYATFAAPTDLGIDPQSVRLEIDGKDVTPSVARTPSFVTYTVAAPLPDGRVNVRATVADFAGNTASRAWSFRIHAR